MAAAFHNARVEPMSDGVSSLAARPPVPPLRRGRFVILSETTPSQAQARAAGRATYVAFIGAGFAFASWAARIPQIRDRLHLQPSELGLVLLSIAAGSVIALPLSGPVLTRLGSRRTVAAMALLVAAGLVIASVGYLSGVLPVVVGLFLFGFAQRRLGRRDERPGRPRRTAPGPVDHAAVPRRLQPGHGRRGAHRLGDGRAPGVGHRAPARRVRRRAVAVPVAVTAVRCPTTAAPLDERRVARPVPWRPGRASAATLLIGVFVLAFAFAEGTGGDWIGIALIDGYHAPATVGTLGFAAFLAAMTIGRWLGPGLLDRYGRVAVTRALSVLARGRSPPVRVRPGDAGRVRRGPHVGRRHVAGVPGRDERRRGRPGACGPARQRGRLDRLLRVPRRPAAHRVPGRQHYTVLRALTAVAALLALAALIAGNVRPLDRS